MKGFDSIISGSVSKNPVQGSLFFLENCISLPPAQHTHTHPCTHNTPLPVLISFLLSFLAQEPRARHPIEWTSSLPALKPRVGRRESSEATKLGKEWVKSAGQRGRGVTVDGRRRPGEKNPKEGRTGRERRKTQRNGQL